MKHSAILIVTLFLVWTNVAVAETVRQRQQREMVETYLEVKLRDVAGKLDRLKKGRAASLDEHSRRELALAREELSRKQELAGRKLTEMKSAGVETWDRLKAEVNAAIDDLDRAYETVSSLLRKK